MNSKKNEKWVKFLLYLVVIVLINLVSGTLFFRLDLTENRSYSLSGVSKRLVASLEEPLTIKVFLSENLPKPYNNLEQQIKDLLEEYSIESNKNFNYALYLLDQEGTATDKEGRNLREMAESYNINSIQIQNIEQDEIKLQTVYMGMVIIQGDMVDTIPSLGSETNIEYKITSLINTISQKTSTLLAMEENIGIKLYLSPDLFQINEEIRNYEKYLKNIINKLNEENFDKIRFESINPSMLTDAEISRYGMNTINLQGGTESKPVNIMAFASVVVEYNGESSAINLLSRGIFGGYSMTPADELEEPIKEIIDRVIGIHTTIGYLSDHGTPALYSNPYMQQQQGKSVGKFNQLMSGNYNLKNITLDNIPESIKTLVIVGPNEPFSQWELFKLDQFIMNGGSVALFLDSFNEQMPSQQQQMYGGMPTYTPNYTGLEELLEKYGAVIENSYVMDENCYIQQQRNNLGSIEETAVYFAPQIDMETINNDIPFMKNIKGLIMFQISPVGLSEELQPGVLGTTLFSSSKKAWEVKENITFNPQMISPPSGDERESYPLAVMLEGSFDSYFDENSIPEPPEPDESEEQESGLVLNSSKMEGKEGFIGKATQGRLFLMGSSTVLRDDLLNVTPNVMLIQNVLDYLNYQEDFAIMRSKGQGFNPLKESTPKTRKVIKAINIFALPFLVIVWGVVMLLVWRSRRKKIALIFKGE